MTSEWLAVGRLYNALADMEYTIKAGDDHFYGAWSGGSASSGGHPVGKPASAKSPAAHARAVAESVEAKYDFKAGAPEQGAYVSLKTGEVVGTGTTGHTNYLAMNERLGGPNTMLTHSHPDDARIMGRVMDGRSFSDGDVRIGIKDDLGAVRAVSRNYEHQITRPEGGWPKYTTVQRLHGVASKEVTASFDKQVSDAINRGDRAAIPGIRARLDEEGPHLVWQKLADDYGFPYTRVAR